MFAADLLCRRPYFKEGRCPNDACPGSERPMLVLSRKVGERIVIGSKITVTVVKIVGNSVRVGVDAPGEMPIVRHELLSAAKDQEGFDRTRQNDSVRTIPTDR